MHGPKDAPRGRTGTSFHELVHQRVCEHAGGIYSTASDISSLWAAMFAGRIVSTDRVAEMVHPHSDVPAASARYGLGFWLHPTRDVVELEGADAGVSFRTVRDPREQLTHTVLSNTTEGAWPIADRLGELLTP